MGDNVFAYFSEFVQAANQARWPKEHIEVVLANARSDDYQHALETVFAALLEMEGEQVAPIEYVE